MFLEPLTGKKIVAGWLLAWRCAEVVIQTGEHKPKRYRKVPTAALIAETKQPVVAKSKRKSPRELAEDWYKTLTPGTVFTPQEATKQCGNGSTATYIHIIDGWIGEGRVKKLNATRLSSTSRLEIARPEATT